MKVKEEILRYMKKELPVSDSVDTTKVWARQHLTEIEEVSKQVILEEGYDYSVKAKVTKCQFPDKSYGDVTFPAGEYEALRIEIGQAEGQNWWCVLYPNLCFMDAVHAVVPEEGKKDLKRVLDEETYDMVTATTRFRIGWFFF
jgi:stage II sporulation protein R